MNDLFFNFLEKHNVKGNLFDSESTIFVSDGFGNIVFQNLILESNCDLNGGNIKDYIVNTENEDFNIFNYLFQNVRFDLSSLSFINLKLYCVPYYSIDSKTLFFWLNIPNNDSRIVNFSNYLDNLVFLDTAVNNSCIVAVTNKSGQITYVNDMFCLLVLHVYI